MDADQEGSPLRARSYAPVAPSTSTSSLEQRVSATRWTSRELQSKIPTAPLFSFGSPSKELLDELVRDYTAITGDPVGRPKKRDLVATCYRVHGPDFIPFVRDYFRVEGTAQNLLGFIRSAPRRNADDEVETYVVAETTAAPPVSIAAESHVGMPCPTPACLPGLIYCAAHRPAFDPRSSRRYDRRLANPDAAGYFIGTEPDR